MTVTYKIISERTKNIAEIEMNVVAKFGYVFKAVIPDKDRFIFLMEKTTDESI